MITKIYKCYKTIGYREYFSFHHDGVESGMYDDVYIELPTGSKMVKNSFGFDAIELANGCICPDLHTKHCKNGTVYPYIIDTSTARQKEIRLKIVNQ